MRRFLEIRIKTREKANEREAFWANKIVKANGANIAAVEVVPYQGMWAVEMSLLVDEDSAEYIAFKKRFR